MTLFGCFLPGLLLLTKRFDELFTRPLDGRRHTQTALACPALIIERLDMQLHAMFASLFAAHNDDQQ